MALIIAGRATNHHFAPVPAFLDCETVLLRKQLRPLRAPTHDGITRWSACPGFFIQPERANVGFLNDQPAAHARIKELSQGMATIAKDYFLVTSERLLPVEVSDEPV